jgi:NAD(P)-dependent dehydrogenase (short-subunit alcohol dehydrogenase family)
VGAIDGVRRRLTPQYADTDTALTALYYERSGRKEELRLKHPFRGLDIPNNTVKVALFLASDDAKWVQSVGVPVDGGFAAE